MAYTVQELSDMEDIRTLKYRYFRSFDLKEWDTFGDCLAADVVTRYGTHAMGEPVHYEGRDAVVDFMRTNLDNGIITTHIASHPEIDIETGLRFCRDLLARGFRGGQEFRNALALTPRDSGLIGRIVRTFLAAGPAERGNG